jgi:hypothetical protein
MAKELAALSSALARPASHSVVARWLLRPHQQRGYGAGGERVGEGGGRWRARGTSHGRRGAGPDRKTFARSELWACLVELVAWAWRLRAPPGIRLTETGRQPFWFEECGVRDMKVAILGRVWGSMEEDTDSAPGRYILLVTRLPKSFYASTSSLFPHIHGNNFVRFSYAWCLVTLNTIVGSLPPRHISIPESIYLIKQSILKDNSST